MAQKRNSALRLLPGGELRKKAKTGAKDYYDYNLLAVVILLTCFGLVMLYSTSAYEASVQNGNDMFYFGKQAAISAVALGLVVWFSQYDYHWFCNFAELLYAVSIVMLIATKFIGREVNGAKRWIYFGPISFQPAEMAKLAIIMFLPVLITGMGRKMKGIAAPALVLVAGGGASLCTYVFTENLSTGLIIAGITCALIFIVHPNTKVTAAIGAGGAVFVIILVNIIINVASADSENFRLRRIMVWLDPERYSAEGGYQVVQGLYAIGSGGFFGKGLGNSAQKLGAVPEAHNDMIFSIICEELGLFGAGIVVLLFVFMLYRLVYIARNAPDLLGSLIACGIFVHISLQVVLNIAVVLNVIPTTGITLPFVSYGGTSIMFLMAEMMLALSISKQITFKN